MSKTPTQDQNARNEAIDALERGIRDWEYLSEEEKHGTLVTALQALKNS